MALITDLAANSLRIPPTSGRLCFRLGFDGYDDGTSEKRKSCRIACHGW